MAKATAHEADNQIYDMIRPFITAMERRLNYTVPIFWPGIKAPVKPTTTQIYVNVERRILSKPPLGVESDSGFLAKAEVRVMIYATEEKTDFALCTSIADQMAQALSRRRCGPSMVLFDATWEDTENRYGRRIFNVVINYEYETGG